MSDDTVRIICDKCGVEYGIGDYPFCKGGHGRPADTRYIQDDIPGGVLIENLGRHPVRVYSHSERLRLAKSRGLEECVRYSGPFERHVQRWDGAGDLQGAEALVKRHYAEAVAGESDVVDVSRPFNVTIDPEVYGEENIAAFLKTAEEAKPTKEAREAWQSIRSDSQSR